MVGHVTDVDLVRLRAIRDATWTAIVSHALDPLVDAIRGMSFALAVDAGRLTLAAERPADIVVARLVDSVLAAQADRSWGRLKACARCDWVFYDRSKNRSGRWCTMDACGSRHKARAYRHRRSINDHLT